MTRKVLGVLGCAFALALFAGCDRAAIAGMFNQVSGSGKASTATRSVPEFTRLSIESSVDAVVKIGTPQSVVVEGDDNLLANVRTEVRNGTLVIDTDKSFSTKIGLKVQITVAKLEGLAIDGSGDVSVDGLGGNAFEVGIDGSGDVGVRGTVGDLKLRINGSGDVSIGDLAAKTATVSVSGSGDVRLRGAVDTLTVRINGSGDVNCADLKAKRAEVDTNGSGDTQIFASEAVHAEINGSGDVFCAGNPPSVQAHAPGSGEFVRR